MPLADIVQITTTLQSKATTRPGFGTPLVTGELPAAVVTLGLFTDRVVIVTANDYDDVLLALGFTTSDAIYKAVESEFAQGPSPERVFVGRRATPVAQVNTVSIDGTTNGTFTTTINGVDFTFLAAGNTDTEIRDGLIADINGGTEPVTAAPDASNTFTLTADEDGVSFSVEVDHSTTPTDISVASTTPNSGIVEDLIAITAENNGWYALVETTHSNGVYLTAASWIEANNRIMLAQSNSADIGTSATDDLFSKLGALGYARTAPAYSNLDTEYFDAAWTGDCLPTNPGSITWAFREISSVTPSVGEAVSGAIDATFLANLNAKNGNYLERVAGRNVTRHGRMADGTFIDLVRGRDWLDINIALDIFDHLANSDKVGFTDEGIAEAVAVLRARLVNASSKQVGLIVPGSIQISAPSAASVPVADRADRHLPDIEWSATLQGAIHSVGISGVLAV